MLVQYYILGERFQLFASCVWCFMHMAVIGLFGQHVCNSVVHNKSTTLRNDLLIKGHANEGSPMYINSEAALERV